MASDAVIFRSNSLSFVARTCYYCGNQNSQIKDHDHGRQTLPAGATSNPRDAASAVFGRLCVRAQSGACHRCVLRHAGPASPEDARQCSIDARARGARRASIRHDQALGGDGSFSDARTCQVPRRVGGWHASHWDHSLDRVFSPPLIKPDVRISRIRLTDEITLARVIRSGVCDAL